MYELAEAVNLFSTDLLEKRKLTPLQRKVLGKIASCRTASLGGHEEECDSCGSVRYSYNSCGDRHCPKCQAAKQAFWIDELVHSTLPVKHFHIVFTAPHGLNTVCLHLDSLKRSLRKQKELSLFKDKIKQAYAARWVVHCEPSLAGADHVIKYLGQYTHRVAITNQRILNITNGKVTFSSKDYRDRAVKKPVTLYGAEFLRRFTLHILPARFVKIRRYGIYNHTVKRNLRLQFVPEASPDIDSIRHQPYKLKFRTLRRKWERYAWW
ncbi:MAG: transposase [Bacteroidales bacterium]|nr:transposase [Bacteroidales bacterium]